MRVPALFAILLFPAIAFAQPPAKVDIAAGETVTLRIAGDGAAIVDSRKPAGPLQKADAAFMGQAKTTEIVPGVRSQPAIPANGPAPPPPVAGVVRISLRLVQPPDSKGPNGDMLLSIDNGYDAALRYKAVMHRGDRSAPTDVCIVVPLKRGYEQWPYPFDRIELSNFSLIPWHASDGIACE